MLAWILNLDDAASEPTAVVPTALMGMNARRTSMYPPLVALLVVCKGVIGLG